MQAESITGFSEEWVDKLDKVQRVLQKADTNIMKDFYKIQGDSAVYGSKIFNAEIEHKKFHERNENFEGSIRTLFEKITFLDTEKQDKVNAADKEEDLIESFNRLKDSVDQKENKLRTLERFIDRYVPIRI